jgi:diguanylate cyclase (GGDEF)-like protein
MKSTPLKVLLVSRNQAMLASLSKFLDLLGVAAIQAVDPRQATAAAASELPDILILDAELLPDGGRELCRAVCGGGMRHHVFTLLLIDEPARLDEMVEALKLGVDDFLAKSIVFGELLARLRAAARGLEYERRVQAYLGTDPLVALPTAAALGQALRAALEEHGRTSPVACVALDLDFFNRLNYMYGKPEADEALRSVAKLLQKSCSDRDLAASCGDDKFYVLLPGRSEAAAKEWAEQFRHTLAEAQIPVGIVAETITASFGVAASEGGAFAASAILDRADQALQAAKRFGRNCVVQRTSLDDESNAWTNLAAPGKLFDRTVARDVMSPCTVSLRPEEPIAEAATLLERTGQAALPVTDRDGKLMGLVMAEDLQARAENGARSAARVCDVMLTNPVRFAEDASFAELVKFFSQDERWLGVIIAEDRPTGIVTRSSLASLSEPLAAESYAPEREYPVTSDYLLVPETCGRL